MFDAQDRQEREQSYSDRIRQGYAAYLETCKREGLEPGYGHIVEWAEGERDAATVDTEINDEYPF